MVVVVVVGESHLLEVVTTGLQEAVHGWAVVPPLIQETLLRDTPEIGQAHAVSPCMRWAHAHACGRPRRMHALRDTPGDPVEMAAGMGDWRALGRSTALARRMHGARWDGI